MTQASKANLAKTRILETLAQFPQGMRYNKLFKKVENDIASLHTFEKYLQDLEHQHFIERGPDPEDARAVLVELVPEETGRYLQMLQAFRDMEEFAKKIELTYNEATYNVQEGEVVNLIRVAHSMYSHLHKDKIPIDAYVSVESEGPLIRLMSSGRVSELLTKEARLDELDRAQGPARS